MERVWGGRRLETLFGKPLPPGKKIGESWEIVDRPEAQSLVADGEFRGLSLHQLWMEKRSLIFGHDLPDTPRFPLLLKLLDAAEKLSLQVHPPAKAAESLGGEAKTEHWYFAEAEESEIFAGLRAGVTKEDFAQAIHDGKVADLVHRIPVTTGDHFFVPSGRLHGIGAGNLIVEIQQNSDTTYRVFDWNRAGADGQPRKLHVAQSLASIRFEDFEPELPPTQGERLLSCEHFVVEEWDLTAPRRALDRAEFALFVSLKGGAEMGAHRFSPGDCFLVPANAGETQIRPQTEGCRLLRITLPAR